MSDIGKELIEIGEDLYQGKIKGENSLGNSENMIFEMETETSLIILRISPYSKEKHSHVELEAYWLRHLSKSMEEVARVVESVRGRHFEVVSIHGDKYILMAFEKAPGKPVDVEDPKEWNEDLFERLGEVMGRMHSLSKEIQENKEFERAHPWHRDIFFQQEFDSCHDGEIQKLWERITAELGKLRKSKDSYGIIHNDLHQLNFFMHNRRITVFDFDNCLYSWYAMDIAITLYQVASIPPYKDRKARNQLAEAFIIPFLRGYGRHNSLDPFWADYLPLFLKYRRICSYRFVKHLVKKEKNPMLQEYAHWIEQEVLRDGDYLSLDFNRIRSMF